MPTDWTEAAKSAAEELGLHPYPDGTWEQRPLVVSLQVQVRDQAGRALFSPTISVPSQHATNRNVWRQAMQHLAPGWEPVDANSHAKPETLEEAHGLIRLLDVEIHNAVQDCERVRAYLARVTAERDEAVMRITKRAEKAEADAAFLRTLHGACTT